MPDTRAHARDRPDHGIPVTEWIAAALGFTLLAATVVFMAWRAIAAGGGPPSFDISVAAQEPVAGGFVVVFDVINGGGTTAADVEIEGTLTSGSQVIETGRVTLPYLPPGSQRRGGLYFRHDPRQGQLELRALGYRSP